MTNSLRSSASQLYFSFGSNMSTPQMLERCPSAERVGIGVIPTYELVFKRKGSYRPGGVASIVPSEDPGQSVFGVIWKITSEDLEGLDKIEDPSAYERVTIDVQLLEGQTFPCQTYLAFPQAQHVTPDPHYLELLLDAAKAAALPQDYIELISRFRSHD